MRRSPLVFALFLLLLANGALAQDGYHRLAEVDAQLDALASAHPESVQALEIGRSKGGHPIRVLRVAAAGETDPAERPALFVGANLAGFHNAGTEAALDLLAALLDTPSEAAAALLASRTFYIAPALHPDAHDALFATPRVRRQGHAGRLDRDRDGFEAEDGPDDLDGDGRITTLRIADPTGDWLPHPDEPRLLVRADAAKGWVGRYRLVDLEGRDNDGDGDFNEDPPEGVIPDHNFPHAFPFPDDPAAGPWPSYAPESKALLDFFFAHRQIALAVVYGPANNLLALPESLGGGGDTGTLKFKVPPRFADAMGLDPEEEYDIDEIWEAAQQLSFVRSNNITKEQLAQFLGAGPATKIEDDDRKILTELAKTYKKALEDAGLDTKRPAAQYQKGGLVPWLYYQYGALALELDVWGVPEPAPAPKKEGEEEADGVGEKTLSVEALDTMSAEDFLAFGEEKIAAFLEAAGVPPQFSAAMVIQRIESGQIDPPRMAEMIRRTGGGSGGSGSGSGEDGDAGDDTAKDDKETERRRNVLTWLDEHMPDAVRPWTEVELEDGTVAEAGGLDPFAEIAPPHEILAPALRVHTAQILDWAAKLPEVEMLDVRAEALGGGVYRIEATAANRDPWPTHTRMAVRTRALRPVRLDLELPEGVELLTGVRQVTADRLEGKTGTVRGEWLVRGEVGMSVGVVVRTETAGEGRGSVVLP